MQRMLVAFVLVLVLLQGGCMKEQCAVWRPLGYACPPELIGGK
jgi:hypothetical protein